MGGGFKEKGELSLKKEVGHQLSLSTTTLCFEVSRNTFSMSFIYENR